MVKTHSVSLTKIKATLISLTSKIKCLDNQLLEGNIPKHLQVQRNLSKPPGSLTCSEELRDIWDSHLQKAGKRLGQAWRQELSHQAERFKNWFQEKKGPALT
ncbi:hypothetical protein HOLleu_40715 [Holothuria leucospilota]|uniref:Uncharacterized protein n=1 Tax=Holothuria leucospilota TaxID=206669 RepID=A0A9Q0YLD2_HOLLE|nr:hypothetical protein HOLleu_40715 [Holothuria leucospilota]